jgi:hypothetical protein
VAGDEGELPQAVVVRTTASDRPSLCKVVALMQRGY